MMKSMITSSTSRALSTPNKKTRSGRFFQGTNRKVSASHHCSMYNLVIFVPNNQNKKHKQANETCMSGKYLYCLILHFYSSEPAKAHFASSLSTVTFFKSNSDI